MHQTYECSTKTHNITFFAIKIYCENSQITSKKTDLELLDIAKANNSKSQYAKTLIINRYLPKY